MVQDNTEESELQILKRHSDGVLHAAERLTEGEKRPRPKLQRSEAQQAADAVDCNFIQVCSNLFKCVQTCPNVFKCVQMCSNVFKLVQRSEAHQAADAVDCKVTRRQKLWHFL